MANPEYSKKLHFPQESKELIIPRKTYYDQNGTVGTSSIYGATKKYLKELYSFHGYPTWFITIQYYPVLRTFEDAEKEARFINNLLLSKILNCHHREIRTHPKRPLVLWFHEKAGMIINSNKSNPKYGIAYHSHQHLGNCPKPYSTYNSGKGLRLEAFLRSEAQRISKDNSRFNQGVKILPWNYRRHAFYNLKDFYRYKNHQDNDLVFDPKNMILPERGNSECILLNEVGS